MRSRDELATLAQLHGRPSCGGLSQAASDRVWGKVAKAIAAAPAPQVGAWARAMVLPRLFADVVARPTMIGTLIVVLAMGGWISGVNASLTTVPGDALYSVKLVSEKAQLSLASESARPKLQAEFASRRVREVAELVKRPEAPAVKQEKVRVAVNGFKKHIVDLQEAAAAQPSEASAVEVARVVEQKESELKEVLETVKAEEVADGVVAGEQSVSEAIGEAVSVAGAAKEAAVETLVVRVEEAAKEATATQESVTPSSEELERQIRNALRELAADSQMLLSRIDRVERALLDRGWRTDVIDVRLARYAVRSQAEPTSAAMDIAARGSYREALERIAVISQKLGEVRVTLTEAEIKLVQAAQQEQEEREAKARVVEEEAAEQVEENNDGVPVKQETDAEAPVSKSSPP